jgi:hypothetical protein
LGHHRLHPRIAGESAKHDESFGQSNSTSFSNSFANANTWGT